MGSASSRAARNVLKETPSSRVRATAEQTRRQPLAFESKNEVDKDAKDPHFMEKLSQLGQVRVDHHMPWHTVRAANDIQNMYHSRIQSEAEASSLQATKNRLLASTLTELLGARKSVSNDAELEALAKQYHIDAAKLQQLVQVVNTPSIDERTVMRTTDKHGEESLTMTARWVDPVQLKLNYRI